MKIFYRRKAQGLLFCRYIHPETWNEWASMVLIEPAPDWGQK